LAANQEFRVVGFEDDFNADCGTVVQICGLLLLLLLRFAAAAVVHFAAAVVVQIRYWENGFKY
jgi:hypothetical protein